MKNQKTFFNKLNIYVDTNPDLLRLIKHLYDQIRNRPFSEPLAIEEDLSEFSLEELELIFQSIPGDVYTLEFQAIKKDDLSNEALQTFLRSLPPSITTVCFADTKMEEQISEINPGKNLRITYHQRNILQGL